METKELVLAKVQPPSNMDELQRLAKMLMASGFFKDAADVAKCGVKILAGQELGIGPVASCTHVYFVNGKLAYEAQLLASAVRRKGYDYRVKEHTDKSCSITFFAPGKEELGTSTFTIDDAKKAGLDSKDIWKKYPRNMLFGRALTNGVRWYCPDIFGGAVYTPEELNAEVNSDGSYVEDKKAPEIIWKGAAVSEQSAKLNEMFSPKVEGEKEQEVLI